MSLYTDVIGNLVEGIEAVGAAIMTVGGAFVLLRFATAIASGRFDDHDYRRLRSDLGRVILVGLEVLIVADIVRTIIVEASLTSVAVLGTIVAIRTVLSVSLDIEIDGTLPWRQAGQRQAGQRQAGQGQAGQGKPPPGTAAG